MRQEKEAERELDLAKKIKLERDYELQRLKREQMEFQSQAEHEIRMLEQERLLIKGVDEAEAQRIRD
jgi:sulfite reductase beta subunit-like hemoprotein